MDICAPQVFCCGTASTFQKERTSMHMISTSRWDPDTTAIERYYSEPAEHPTLSLLQLHHSTLEHATLTMMMLLEDSQGPRGSKDKRGEVDRGLQMSYRWEPDTVKSFDSIGTGWIDFQASLRREPRGTPSSTRETWNCLMTGCSKPQTQK